MNVTKDIKMTSEKTIAPEAIEVLINLSRTSPPLFKNGKRDALIALFQECESKEHFSLLERLITDFHYFTSSDLQSGAEKIADFITSEWKLNPKQTLIVATTDDDRTDGAQVLIKSLEAALSKERPKYTIKNRLGFAFNNEANAIGQTNNLVLIDDFIGTGDKICKLINRIKEHANTINSIYVASLAGMKFGIQKIESTSPCKVYCPHQFEKGISDLQDAAKTRAYTDAMIELEQAIITPMKFPRDDRERSYSFGYGQSEALFVLEGFTVPNNVFPIFWKNAYCDTSPFEPNSPAKKSKGVKRERTTLLARG